MLNALSNFLNNRKQRVAFNIKTSFWLKIDAGGPQRSILGPRLSLIYISDLSDGLSSNVKLFADDRSLFLVKFDFNAFTSEQTCEVKKINDMSSNGK